MEDLGIGDVLEDSFTIEDTKPAYVLTEFGDGYYLGPPVAVFTSEEAANIFKENYDGRLVMVESEIYTTDKDGYVLRSRSIKRENAVKSIVIDAIETEDKFRGCEVSQIIKDYNISPDDILGEESVEMIAEHLFASVADAPELWEEPVQEFAEDYYDEE